MLDGVTSVVKISKHAEASRCARCSADGAESWLLDAAEVARRLNVERAWVYANAARLGAVRLGDGPRARLRFEPSAVRAALQPVRAGAAATHEAPTARPRRRRRTGVPRHAPLLVIKDRR